MLEMVMTMFFVFGGFGLLAIAYAIANIIIGVVLAFVHMYKGGNHPKEIFTNWMKYI